jgi:hypothetical protein
MVKALARAFRWRKMLDTGVHATLEELTLLAPEIIEAILDDGSRRSCSLMICSTGSAAVGGSGEVHLPPELTS